MPNLTPTCHADEDPDAIYELGTESQRHEGVPKGDVTKHVWQSNIFEGEGWTMKQFKKVQISLMAQGGYLLGRKRGVRFVNYVL